MKEKWTKWEPIAGLEGTFYIDEVIYSDDSFIIKLSDEEEKKRVQVLFENSVDAYRCTGETYRYKKIMQLHEEYGKEFYVEGTFFKVTNSEYLQWLSDESCTISDNIPFIHFLFLGADTFVDVVTSYEPKIELIHTP